MGRTPDRRPGAPLREEESAYFDPQTTLADTEGQLLYSDTGRWSFYDSSGEFDPRAGGGITEAQHKVLRQLIHFIDDGPAEGFPSGSYKETLPAGSPFPTSEIWYESSAKSKMIVSLATTWSGAIITQEVWDIYDTDGSTSLVTITDAISYSGFFETSRTRTIVVH
jgi:hypothetical protein